MVRLGIEQMPKSKKKKLKYIFRVWVAGQYSSDARDTFLQLELADFSQGFLILSLLGWRKNFSLQETLFLKVDLATKSKGLQGVLKFLKAP